MWSVNLQQHDATVDIQAVSGDDLVDDTSYTQNDVPQEMVLNQISSNVSLDKQMKESYMSLYLKMSQVYQIPKTHCAFFYRKMYEFVLLIEQKYLF
jgi:hypothetical protein